MVNTLTKFGVPVNGVRQGPLLMPKIKHRYRVLVTNFGGGINQTDLTQQVMTVDRPQVNFNSNPVHSYNSVMYYAQKPEWQALNLTVRDDINNSVSRLVGQQLQKQMNFFEQTSYAAAINYKFQMRIEMMDGGNVGVLEGWFLEGCFIETANYNNLDYSSSDIVEISLTVKFDNATSIDTMPAAILPTLPLSPLL